MNLLTDNWIPVRPLYGGELQTLTLRALLCDDTPWILCLPRDDMELAALQLLICLVQVTWIPADDASWKNYLDTPLTPEAFDQGIAQWGDLFRLDHPQAPFMQVKGVVAKELTGMDKLLVGLTGTTNCAFLNEPAQGQALCAGCAAIALFNQANNAPGFGGGFKNGLRGGSPVTCLIQARYQKRADLRNTLWLNVLTQPRLEQQLSGDIGLMQPPTWRQPIKANETISAATIGLLRGLFWQPAHVELSPPIGEGQCSGCGQQAAQRYDGFLKAKFGFQLEGVWPHPHSPRLFSEKKGVIETKFLSFTTPAPSWTQISRLLVAGSMAKGERQQPAAAVSQIADMFPLTGIEFLIGGYRTHQASILERRHEALVVNQGWQQHTQCINQIVEVGLAGKTALRKALYTFVSGMERADIKGAGVSVHEVAERDYYRRSDQGINNLLATLDFSNAAERIEQLKRDIRALCLELFDQVTSSYAHHPKLLRVLAIARRSLYKQLSELGLLQGGEYAH